MTPTNGLRGRPPAAAFRAALVSIDTNPKAVAFGIVVLPQFLPASGPGWCVGVVLAADQSRNIMSQSHIRRRIERVMGATLVAL